MIVVVACVCACVLLHVVKIADGWTDAAPNPSPKMHRNDSKHKSIKNIKVLESIIKATRYIDKQTGAPTERVFANLPRWAILNTWFQSSYPPQPFQSHFFVAEREYLPAQQKLILRTAELVARRHVSCVSGQVLAF